MRTSLRNLRPEFPRLRKWAALGAATLAATVLAALVPGAASAQSSTYIYLAHEASYGMYAEAGVTNGSDIGIKTAPWGTWLAISYGTTSEHGITGQGYEFESITTSGSTNGLCMTDTGFPVTLGPCGADGTVFVEVPSEGGYLMYSRYFLNLGEQFALGTQGFGNGYLIASFPPSELTTGTYYRWAFTDL